MDALQLRDNAKQQLTEIKTIETGITYLNKVKAIEAWAKAEKKDAELQNIIAEQKLRTQRILGGLLKETDLASRKENSTGLSSFGLNKKQSHEFQKIALLPEEIFEEEISTAKDESSKRIELTTSRMLQAAKEYQKTIKKDEIINNAKNFRSSNIKLLEGDLFDKIDDIENNSIDLLNTDPPYFILDDSWDAFNSLNDFLVFTEKWLKAVKPKLKKTARVYISFAPDYKYYLYKILEKLNYLDLKYGNEIIWVKKNNNKLFSQVKYRLTYEPIIYLYGNENKLNFTDDTFGEVQTDVWEIATPQSNFKEGKYHTAQKPLELYRRIIKTGSFENDTILDCFAGSGTTGIICKELNRNCILIEKDIENINLIKGRL